MKQRGKRATGHAMLKRLEEMEATAAACKNPNERRALWLKAGQLRQELISAGYIETPKSNKKRPYTAPLPQSYKAARAEARKTAQRISGRKNMKIKILQGGSMSKK